MRGDNFKPSLTTPNRIIFYFYIITVPYTPLDQWVLDAVLELLQRRSPQLDCGFLRAGTLCYSSVCSGLGPLNKCRTKQNEITPVSKVIH